MAETPIATWDLEDELVDTKAELASTIVHLDTALNGIGNAKTIMRGVVNEMVSAFRNGFLRLNISFPDRFGSGGC